MGNLADELNQKQVLKFQLNKFGGLDRKFIKKTLTDNYRGIFNLSSKIDRQKQKKIEKYLCENYQNYHFELENDFINPMIHFKKAS